MKASVKASTASMQARAAENPKAAWKEPRTEKPICGSLSAQKTMSAVAPRLDTASA